MSINVKNGRIREIRSFKHTFDTFSIHIHHSIVCDWIENCISPKLLKSLVMNFLFFNYSQKIAFLNLWTGKIVQFFEFLKTKKCPNLLEFLPIPKTFLWQNFAILYLSFRKNFFSIFSKKSQILKKVTRFFNLPGTVEHAPLEPKIKHCD